MTINRSKREKNDEHYTQLSDIKNGSAENFSAQIGASLFAHAYDFIDNQTNFVANSTPNSSTQQLYIPCYDNNGNVTMYYDAETGLYYYGYRFYSPTLMRWLNRDPIGERGGLNLYCFVVNSSLDSVDPFGQKRLSLSYDFALDTPEYERRTNWSTLSEISIAEAEQDIRDQVGRYSPKGEGKCNCVERITFAGHGSEGVIYLGNAGDNMLAGSTFRTTQSKNFPHAIFSLLSTVKSLACDRMTLRFATCLSGKGVAGKDLQDELDKFFGDNVSVVLYVREVGFIFNHVIPRLF